MEHNNSMQANITNGVGLAFLAMLSAGGLLNDDIKESTSDMQNNSIHISQKLERANKKLNAHIVNPIEQKKNNNINLKKIKKIPANKGGGQKGSKRT